MSSSISNSEPKGRRGSRRANGLYGLGLILLFALFFAVFQFLVPQMMPELRGGRADFVLKLLGDQRVNVVIGDSHVGQRDRMGEDYLFLGRPGATTFELLQATKTFFRDKDPGRVILEAGPQHFSETRQAAWQTFNKDSFKFQVSPLSLYIFEPEIIKKSPIILGLGEAERFRYRLKSHRRKLPKEVAKARVHGEKLAKVKGRLTTIDEIPHAARDILVSYRFDTHLPVPDPRDSLAWAYYIELLDFLEARGAEVCILRMPISPEFQGMIHDRPEGRRYQTILEDLRGAATARGMNFFDFTEIFPDLPSFYYKNQDHLNDLGHEVFWPAAEAACFDEEEGGTAAPQNSGGVYHQLALKNAGFEARVTEKGGDPNSCPPGWLWRSPLPVKRLLRYPDAVEQSAFRSEYAYGLKAAEEGGKGGWWSLGKRFRVKGGEAVEIAVKVRSDDLAAAPKDADLGPEEVFLSDHDAFFKIEAFDADGNAIALTGEARHSEPLSAQAYDPARRRLFPEPWHRLTHGLTLPEEARELRVWLTAVSGGGEVRPLGWKGGEPHVLFDDFEILSDGKIKEIKLAKGRGQNKKAGGAKSHCGPGARKMAAGKGKASGSVE